MSKDMKIQLALRVSELFAKSDGYKNKNNTEKMKTCSQCGTKFHGRADQSTCSTKCRVAKHRG